MKRWLTPLLLGLVAGLIHLVLLVVPIVGDTLEGYGLDLWFNLRGAIDPPKDVVIVAMDEESYDVLNAPLSKPWPRELHAKLLNRLADYGAKGAAMDILFLSPGDDKASDAAFVSALKRLPVVLGVDTGSRDESSSSAAYKLRKVYEPFKDFRENAAALGLVSLPPSQGVLRKFFEERDQVTSEIPSLGEAAAQIATGEKREAKEGDFIWYYGPSRTVKTFSYHQVLNEKGQLPASEFKDKIVFVGLSLKSDTGPAAKDSFRIPFYSSPMFGLEIHATIAANLIEGKWLHRGSPLLSGVILFLGTILCTALVCGIAPQWGIIVYLGVSAIWATSAYLSFNSGTYIPGFIGIAIILPLAYLASTFTFYILALRSRLQVEKAFEYYLSPEMAKEMSKNPKGLQLGGENIFATAMFTDIAGFTELTEQMNAAQVSTMLNAYFTEVMNVIFENKGTLIKFIGDAVFVLWGAPIKVADHAFLACKTSLGIQEGVRRFNASKRFPALNTRIGIHTGPMVVGNLGSDKRFDYTAIGDSVNLASRIEGINKYFGTEIIITESVKKELGTAGFSLLPLGTIRVIGKKENVPIYTLLAEDLSKEFCASWEQAITYFKQKRWDDAEKLFASISRNDSRLKKAIELYLNEIQTFRTTPPDGGWSGEITFSSK